MSKESIVRAVKKNSILLNRERASLTRKLETSLLRFGDEEKFKLISFDEAQAILLQLNRIGVLGIANMEKSELIHLADKQCVFEKIGINHIDLEHDWYFVFPLDWQVRGAIILSAKFFWENIIEISHLLEDDFDLVNDKLSSVIKFRGERSEELLKECYVEIIGSYFSNAVYIT